MTRDPSRDTITTIREKFLRDPEFRDQLTVNSDESLAPLLGPLSGRETAPTDGDRETPEWAAQAAYPDKKDQDVRIW